MATIFNNIKSNGASPYAYYTVWATVNKRNENSVVLDVYMNARLATSSASLGTGSTMGLDVYFNFAETGQTAAWRIKATNESWSKTTNHRLPSSGTKQYTVNVSPSTTSVSTKIKVNRTGSAANTTSTSTGCWVAWRSGTALAIDAWKYNVSYNANGGSSTPTGGSYAAGSTITLSGAISRNSSTANGYTVTYNGNGGTPSTSSQTATDTTSYSFTGWLNSASGSTQAASSTATINADTTFTAQWSSSTSKGSLTSPTASKTNGSTSRVVTYNANGGTCSTTSQTSTAAITYSCTGWWTAASGGTKRANAGTVYTPSATENLYAQWSSSTGTFSSITSPTPSKANTTATRTVSFDANGGSCSTASLNSTQTTTYTQNGWWTATSGGTQVVKANTAYTPSATQTVYAQYTSSAGAWSAITLPTATKANGSTSCTITFDGNGGSTPTAMTSTATITYSQTGWWTATSGGTNRGAAGASYTPSAAETLHAQFSSSTGTYSKITLPVPIKSGFNFVGWSTNKEATSGITGDYTPTGNVILYAIWASADVKINFKNNNAWIKGIPYVKNNGEWKKAKKVYVKINNVWKEAI